MGTFLETRHGRRAAARTSREAHDFMAGARDGWSIVSTSRGGTGMTTHHGVVHPDEYVDERRLRAMVEDELGFTIEQVRLVYRQGKKSEAQLELRARIDARMLELASAGGNLSALGRVFGLRVNDGCRPLQRAVARASAV